MKPRGVAGTVLVYKVLGGASISGKNLDEICDLGEHVLGQHVYFWYMHELMLLARIGRKS